MLYRSKSKQGNFRLCHIFESSKNYFAQHFHIDKLVHLDEIQPI